MNGEYVLWTSFKVVDIPVRGNQSIDASRALSTSLVPFYSRDVRTVIVCACRGLWIDGAAGMLSACWRPRRKCGLS